MKSLLSLLVALLLGAFLLSAQVKPEIVSQIGHSDIITSTIFSPDGKKMVSSSRTSEVILWDVETGLELKNFKGHSGKVNGLAFSPDGKLLISCGSSKNEDEGEVILWDIETGLEIRRFLGHQKEVFSVYFSQSGENIISVDISGYSKTWNVKTGKELYSCDLGTEKSLYIPNGDEFICTNDRTIRIKDNKTGKEYKNYTDSATINRIAVSLGGKILVTAGWGEYNKHISMWDLKNGKKIRILNNDENINTLAISPDGDKIIVGSSHSTIRLLDVKTGIELYRLKNIDATTLSFSSDGSMFIAGGYSHTITAWFTESGKEAQTYAGKAIRVNSVDFSPNGNEVLSSNTLWNISNASRKWSYLPHPDDPYYSYVPTLLTPDGKYFLTLASSETLMFSNTATSELIWEKKIQNSRGAIALSPDGSTFINCAPVDPEAKKAVIESYDIKSGNVLKSFQNDGNITNLTFSPSGNMFASGGYSCTIKIWDTNSGKELKSLLGHKNAFNVSNIRSLVFSPDGKKLVSSGADETVRIWDVETGTNIKTFSGFYDVFLFNLDGKSIFLSNPSHEFNIQQWDIETGQVIKTFVGHTDLVTTLAISPDGKRLLSGSYDATSRIWDISTGEELVRLINFNNNEWAVLTPDGYFDSSPKGGEFLPIVKGNDFWAIDQFAIRYNRPDIILKRLGSQNKELITFFENKYKKRLKKFGLTEEQLSSEMHAPTAKIVGKEQTEKFIDIKFNFKDTKYNLLRYNVYVNDVPLFGAIGKKLSGSSADLSERIELVPGENKIEVSCVNEKGVESLRAMTRQSYNNQRFLITKVLFGSTADMAGFKVNDLILSIDDKYFTSQADLLDYIKPKREYRIKIQRQEKVETISVKKEKDIFGFGFVKLFPDLYLLAFGVSKYQNTAYNLAYADKDATDLARVVDSLQKIGYENVYTKVFTNEQVTPETIKASKDFVKNAKPDDTFILFIAGHGMHDSDPEATYYYLTSNADIKNLKGTAADFETIEDLLQGIPPRNKLFLMDACESGEIDEEDQGKMLAAATGAGISSRGFKSNQIATSIRSAAGNRSYLYQKDRYIYNDLVRRSGAIVFSSSKGGEFSYERSDIQNGLFTYWVMKALSTKEADKDGNRIISTDELRNYVSSQVAKASGELQHPTVDRDNIYQKFGIPVK